MYLTAKLRDKRDERIDRRVLKRLLHDSAPIHLEGQLHRVPHQETREAFALSRTAVVEQLLDHVVPEHVRHQAEKITHKRKERRRAYGGMAGGIYLHISDIRVTPYTVDRSHAISRGGQKYRHQKTRNYHQQLLVPSMK